MDNSDLSPVRTSIVTVALLISPCETHTAEFFQKIGDKFIPIKKEDMYNKTLADIVALEKTLFYKTQKNT